MFFGRESSNQTAKDIAAADTVAESAVKDAFAALKDLNLNINKEEINRAAEFGQKKKRLKIQISEIIRMFNNDVTEKQH